MSLVSRELVKLKEEQERLRHRQVELERMRRAAESKPSVHADTDRRRRRPDNSSLERQEERRRSHRRQKEQEEKAATKIQASFRGFRSRQELRERHRK